MISHGRAVGERESGEDLVQVRSAHGLGEEGNAGRDDRGRNGPAAKHDPDLGTALPEALDQFGAAVVTKHVIADDQIDGGSGQGPFFLSFVDIGGAEDTMAQLTEFLAKDLHEGGVVFHQKDVACGAFAGRVCVLGRKMVVRQIHGPESNGCAGFVQ